MRSIVGSLVELQALVDVSIGAFGGGARETVTALIDTGATRTCITDSLIQRLALPPRGKLLVASATSYPERRRAYAYSLGFFCQNRTDTERTLYVLDHEFIAPPFQDNGNFQVLLGMDILSRGRLLFEPDETFEFGFSF